jgi:hypothetical protein
VFRALGRLASGLGHLAADMVSTRRARGPVPTCGAMS